MRKKILFPLCGMMLLLLPTGSVYGARAGIGMTAGYVEPANKNHGSGMLYGVNFSFEIIKYIALELSGVRFQSEVTGAGDSLSAGKLTAMPLQLSLQVRWPVFSQLTLYVSGGGGYYLNKFALDPEVVNDWNALNFDVEEKIDNAYGFHAGAGFDFFIVRKIAVNIDFKYCLVKTSGSWTLTDRTSSVGTSGDIADINLDAIMLAAGIKIFF